MPSAKKFKIKPKACSYVYVIIYTAVSIPIAEMSHWLRVAIIAAGKEHTHLSLYIMYKWQHQARLWCNLYK